MYKNDEIPTEVMKDLNLDNLKFRRQFLISTEPTSKFTDWTKEKMEPFFIYVHPDCELNIIKENRKVCLIGYLFDPNDPNKTTKRILNEFSHANTLNEIIENLYPLVGRFVLLIADQDDFYIFNDACGLKTLYYIFEAEEFYAASQPKLLDEVIALKKGARYHTYKNSKYVKLNAEHYLPCGVTLYENVGQLVPNHYLNVKQQEQIRFWPNEHLTLSDYDTSLVKVCELLRKTLSGASSRYSLSVGLTAGLDTRLILSACKEVSKDTKFFTLQYRDLTENSPDISIPKKIASKFGLKYEVYDCRGTGNTKFLSIYNNNSDIAHTDDWGSIASGIYENYPQNRIAVKGSCAEVGQCAYFKNGKHPKKVTISDLIDLQYRWDSVDFIREGLNKWHDSFNKRVAKYGYGEFDLFYWEHRVGGWQAQSQLEWDISQDVFTPFNNREMLDLLLRIDPKFRCKPDYKLFKDVIATLRPEISDYPINPIPLSKKVRKIAIKLFKTFGFYKFLRKVIRP